MANLEKIMAETSKSYDNSRKALNNQINAISGDLAAQQNRINAQYAQQAQDLNDQRNWQAQATSMAASRNGGSFGGKLTSALIFPVGLIMVILAGSELFTGNNLINTDNLCRIRQW